MSEPITTIGLIGFGAFGALAAAHLSKHLEVLAHDPKGMDDQIRAAGARPAALEDAAHAGLVVLCVPVQAIPVVGVTIGPMLREGALVCDVGSVKLRPIQWMVDTLPRHAQVLGTHPLFGPQTATELGGIDGEPIVLCRARVEDDTFSRVQSFLTDKLRLKVLEMTADEHDQQMAFVQGLTHLIGRAASAMRLPELPTATLAYRRLLQMKSNTERDAPELFDAIQGLNPYCANTRRAFLESVKDIVEASEETVPVRNR